MMTGIRKTRRQFLQATAAVGMTVTTTRETSAVASGTSDNKPTWDIACRDAHLGETGEADCWSAMKAIDVEGVEVVVEMDGRCTGLFHPQHKYSIAEPDAVKQLRDTLAAHNRKISAFCLHNHFDERPDDEVHLTTKVTRVAAEMGVPAVRLDVVPRKIKDESEFLRFATEIGRRIISETDGSSVRYGIENHGSTTNKPEFLRGLFDGIGSDRFGITLDIANFYWFGYPLSRLYEIYADLAKRTCHTHCKSIQYPESERQKQRPVGWEYGKYCCPVYEGDIDFDRVADILRHHGYRGSLCIENESLSRFEKPKRREILIKEVAFLRKIARG